MEIYSLCALVLIGSSYPNSVPSYGVIRDIPAMWRAVNFVSDPKRLEGDWKCVAIEREGKSVYSCPIGTLSLDQSFYLQINQNKFNLSQNKFIFSCCDPSHLHAETSSALGSGTFRIRESNGIKNQVTTLDQSKNTLRSVCGLNLRYHDSQRTIRCIYELVLNNPNELRIRFGPPVRQPSNELEGSPLWSKDVWVYQRILPYPYNNRILWAGQ